MRAVITVTDHGSGGAPFRGYARHRRQWPRPGRLRRPGDARHQRWRPVPGVSHEPSPPPSSPSGLHGFPARRIAGPPGRRAAGAQDRLRCAAARPGPAGARAAAARCLPSAARRTPHAACAIEGRTRRLQISYGLPRPAPLGQSAHFSPFGRQTGAPTHSPFRLNPIPGILNSATHLIAHIHPGPEKSRRPHPEHGLRNTIFRFTERLETVLDPRLTGHPDSKWHSCTKSHRQ